MSAGTVPFPAPVLVSEGMLLRRAGSIYAGEICLPTGRYLPPEGEVTYSIRMIF